MKPHFISLLFLLISISFLLCSYCQEATEAQILLEIKATWGNPPALISWNSTSGDHCSWNGIYCTKGFVTGINLVNQNQNQPIPDSICRLKNLSRLDLSDNELTGTFPDFLNCSSLQFLNISQNSFIGALPTDIDKLLPFSLTYLDLSENTFSGLYIARKYSKMIKDNLDHESWKLTPFSTLDFTELDILNGLAEENLIGRGGSGTVYKINLRNSTQGTLAVKKIWSGQRPEAKLEKQFQAEVQILGTMRHVNIVKLFCCIACTHTKLVVYEYMENSSLDRWLHGRRRMSKWMPLDWQTRLQIAIGAARGLCYMHHDCSPPVVHRDVKSSNILLDPQFKAKIADFGLARVLLKAGEPETVSAIAGSYGYMAPECEYLRKINQKVDVYSFGVVLLELTTGRRANGGDEEHPFLADWAWHRFQERDRLIDAIDEHIRDPIYMDQVAQVFRLGLISTAKLPPSRPSMKEVLRCLIHCEGKNPQEYPLRGEYEVARLFREQKKSEERELETVTMAGEDGERLDFSVHIIPVSQR